MGHKRITNDRGEILCRSCGLFLPPEAMRADKRLPSGVNCRCHECERVRLAGRAPLPRNQESRHHTRKDRDLEAVRLKARNKLGLRGELCVVCGRAAQARHHPDYSKPLEVLFVCRPCHDALHDAGCLRVMQCLGMLRVSRTRTPIGSEGAVLAIARLTDGIARIGGGWAAVVLAPAPGRVVAAVRGDFVRRMLADGRLVADPETELLVPRE